MKLTDMNYVKEVMARHGVFPKKKYGQNFLISDQTVLRICESCSDDKDVGILEIGPGIGTLTAALAERYRKVVSLEIDSSLIPVLSDTLRGYENTKIINTDAMKVDFKDILKENFVDLRVCVCANLPYYITSPIILRLLENGCLFDSITVMIQKEVADRLTAKPGSSDYGVLTVRAAYYAKTERCFNVSAGSFYPAPKVTSSVIRMIPYEFPPVSVKNPKNMNRIIDAAFGQRRKTLATALFAATEKYTKSQIAEKITYIGFSPDVRGERLGLSDFARLSDILEI